MKRPTPEELAHAVELYWRDGLTLEQVAERLECDHSTIIYHFDAAGIPRRTMQESKALRRGRNKEAMQQMYQKLREGGELDGQGSSG